MLPKNKIWPQNVRKTRQTYSRIVGVRKGKPFGNILILLLLKKFGQFVV